MDRAKYDSVNFIFCFVLLFVDTDLIDSIHYTISFLCVFPLNRTSKNKFSMCFRYSVVKFSVVDI